jgi:hypothetical protein
MARGGTEALPEEGHDPGKKTRDPEALLDRLSVDEKRTRIR